MLASDESFPPFYQAKLGGCAKLSKVNQGQTRNYKSTICVARTTPAGHMHCGDRVLCSIRNQNLSAGFSTSYRLRCYSSSLRNQAPVGVVTDPSRCQDLDLRHPPQKFIHLFPLRLENCFYIEHQQTDSLSDFSTEKTTQASLIVLSLMIPS